MVGCRIGSSRWSSKYQGPVKEELGRRKHTKATRVDTSAREAGEQAFQPAVTQEVAGTPTLHFSKRTHFD